MQPADTCTAVQTRIAQIAPGIESAIEQAVSGCPPANDTANTPGSGIETDHSGLGGIRDYLKKLCYLILKEFLYGCIDRCVKVQATITDFPVVDKLFKVAANGLQGGTAAGTVQSGAKSQFTALDFFRSCFC